MQHGGEEDIQKRLVIADDNGRLGKMLIVLIDYFLLHISHNVQDRPGVSRQPSMIDVFALFYIKGIPFYKEESHPSHQQTSRSEISEGENRFQIAEESPGKSFFPDPVLDQQGKQKGDQRLCDEYYTNHSDDRHESDGPQCRMLCKNQDTQSRQRGDG